MGSVSKFGRVTWLFSQGFWRPLVPKSGYHVGLDKVCIGWTGDASFSILSQSSSSGGFSAWRSCQEDGASAASAALSGQRKYHSLLRLPSLHFMPQSNMRIWCETIMRTGSSRSDRGWLPTETHIRLLAPSNESSQTRRTFLIPIPENPSFIDPQP